MGNEWTKAQEKAIHAKGNVIVSAAAGSGKTAVLTERVFSLLSDPDHPISADRLLVVTFTNAAATEMRTRIEKRLEEECAKNTENHNALMYQKHLISSAKICTIDSFCIDLIRENFEIANVSPTFKIEDENALLPIYQAVFDQLLNERLSENDPDFRDLLDIVGCEYGFDDFRKRVMELFTYSRQIPFPDRYLERLNYPYSIPFDRDHPWCSLAFDCAHTLINDLQKSISAALDQVENIENGEKYNDILTMLADVLFSLREAAEKRDWNGMRDLLLLKPNIRLPGFTGSTNAIYNVFKEPITAVKDAFSTLETTFELSAEDIERQIKRLSRPIACLVEFARDFADRTFKMQCEENLFTFYNTEQMALNMLCRPGEKGIELLPITQVFFDRYDAVLVDEYQDVNDLQDMLFRILSDQEKHLFVVGDIKQSIYAFRGSNPEIFLERKNKAVNVEIADDNSLKKIYLTKNFRSRRRICDFVNFFFRQIMTEQTGKLQYDQDEELVYGAEFPPNDAPATELLFLNDAPKNNADIIAAEGKRIADYIHSVMNEKPFLKDGNGLRQAKFSDFVILLRSVSGNDFLLTEELRRHGIPVEHSPDAYLSTVEVTTVLSLLRIIDNPDNDIELLTVLLSPIFGFSADELAECRAACKNASLISAIAFSAENGNEHAADFLTKLDEFRRESAVLSLPKFLIRLLLITDYLNIVSAMSNGNSRRLNLQLLITYASTYHERSSGGIDGFLNYIEKLPQGTLSAAKIGGGSDVVRITSMHKSKGLQFPICILAHLNDSFFNKDTRHNMLYDDEIGIGFKYFEESASKRIKTVAFDLLERKNRQQRSEEELRVLYVAMTRAEERLALVMPFGDLYKNVCNCACNLLLNQGRVDHRFFAAASSMRDWILMAVLQHPDAVNLRDGLDFRLPTLPTESRLTVDISDADIVENTYEENDTSAPIAAPPDPALIKQLKSNLSYVYPYGPLREIEAKSTVSLLANHAERERFEFSAKPSFMLESGISAARRGTATHHVMQFMRFTEHPDVDAELERLVEWAYITESEAKAIDRTAVKKFFESSLYARILKADSVHREMRFLTELPAERIDPSLPAELKDEKIVVQGAVDLCIIENGFPIVIDFKTDRVNTPEELIETYSEQLNIYSSACNKIFEKPVRERIIYSFALHRAITLP